MTRGAAPVWEECEACGSAAGLPTPDGPRCPACARREVLTEAARVSLEALTAPVIGAWASQWQAAGVSLDALGDLAEISSGAWMHSAAARTFRRTTLRRLSRLHAPRDFEPSRPARLALDLGALPMLEDVRPPDAQRGTLWPRFVDGEGKDVGVYPGPDALTLTLPDGVRAVLYVGMGGQVKARASEGFRCPPHLWEAAEAALSGPYGLTLTLEALTVDGDALTLAASLPGLPTRYSYTVPRQARRKVSPPEGEGQPWGVTFLDESGPVLTVAVPAALWPRVRGALEGGKP